MTRALALGLALLATPLSAQTAPGDLLTQAMLLGPARMEGAGGQLTLFGEAGAISYVAVATGPDCTPSGTACSALSFQAVAPPAGSGDGAAQWQAAGLGGSVTTGSDGWLVLTSQATLGDAAAAFGDWGRLVAEFQSRFGN